MIMRLKSGSAIMSAPGQPNNPQYIVKLVGKVMSVSLETANVVTRYLRDVVMIKLAESSISLDANTLTYLVDANESTFAPAQHDDRVNQECLAVYKIFLYAQSLNISPTAYDECLNIKCVERRALHELFAQFQISVEEDCRRTLRDQRVHHLLTKHNGENDCIILAESEVMGSDILLTNDDDFINRLSNETAVILAKPAALWTDMNIQSGAEPIWKPGPGHPHEHETWWRA